MMTGWGSWLKNDFILISRAAQLLFLVVHSLFLFTGTTLYNLMADQFEELTGLNKNPFGGEGRIFQTNSLPQDGSLGSCWWPGIGTDCVSTTAEKMDGKLQPERSQRPAWLMSGGFQLFSFRLLNVWGTFGFDVQIKCVFPIENCF